MSKKLLFNLNKNVSQDYTYVKYTGTIVTATNTLEKPIKNAILKGDTKYRDVDTGEILDSFDGTKNLELVSVKMPVLTTSSEDGSKTNILRTPEEVVLKGLGDVQDTLNINTGEMIERIGIAKLSQIPDEDFGNFSPYGVNFILTKTANINIRKTKFNKYFLPYRANPKAISNFALCYNTTYNKDFECFALHTDEVQSVQISLSHSRFNGELTKEKMIQLIKELDITLVYELATPTIKTVDLSILDQDENTVTSISSFNDTTHVTTSSDTVPPIFEGYIATKESVE